MCVIDLAGDSASPVKEQERVRGGSAKESQERTKGGPAKEITFDGEALLADLEKMHNKMQTLCATQEVSCIHQDRATF